MKFIKILYNSFVLAITIALICFNNTWLQMRVNTGYIFFGCLVFFIVVFLVIVARNVHKKNMNSNNSFLRSTRKNLNSKNKSFKNNYNKFGVNDFKNKSKIEKNYFGILFTVCDLVICSVILYVMYGFDRLKVVPAAIIREGINRTSIPFSQINIVLVIFLVIGFLAILLNDIFRTLAKRR
jgi:flagellar biosynthesis protein FliP